MSIVPRPSKKIIVLIASAVIVIGAIGVNKFWPKAEAEKIVTPGYDTVPGISGNEAEAMGALANATEFLRSSSEEVDRATTTDDTPDTVSRSISRSIFANAAYLDSKGTLDESSQEAMVADAISQLQQAFTYKQYDAAGLSYLPSESQDTIKSYATGFAGLQISMIIAMQSSVAEIQEDLGVLGDIYAKEAQFLYAMKIPKAIANEHLAIVNNFSKSAAAFKAFANTKADPLLVPMAMRAYQDASAEQEMLLRQVAQFIKSNGIIFTADEAGGYWNAFQ